MTQLPISEQQRDRLLEMCKALFPEFKRGGNFNLINHLCKPGEYESSIDELTEANTNFIHYYNFGKKLLKNETAEEHVKKWFGEIHWLEFCLTHLRYKLNVDIAPLINGIDAINRGGENQDQIHPIDYLYNEFKK